MIALSRVESWALFGSLIVLTVTLGVLARMAHVERRRRTLRRLRWQASNPYDKSQWRSPRSG